MMERRNCIKTHVLRLYFNEDIMNTLVAFKVNNVAMCRFPSEQIHGMSEHSPIS